MNVEEHERCVDSEFAISAVSHRTNLGDHDTTYYYVCDNCGRLAYITREPLPDDGSCLCGCGSQALWLFTSLTKAMQHSHDIYGR